MMGDILETPRWHPASAKASLVAYPFPLSGGVMCYLNLPIAGLTQYDANRLCAMIQTVVIDESAGNEGEAP